MSLPLQAQNVSTTYVDKTTATRENTPPQKEKTEKRKTKEIWLSKKPLLPGNSKFFH
jgi:hypothetical protein